MKYQMQNQLYKNIYEVISLASEYPSIKRIGIFGSIARGEQQSESDLDVIYDYDETNEYGTGELLGYIEAINDTLIEITNATKIDYVWYKGIMESENVIFKNNVLKDITWIYG